MSKQVYLVQFTPPNEFYPTMQSIAEDWEEALSMAQGDVDMYDELDWEVAEDLSEEDVLAAPFGSVYAESNEWDTVVIIAIDEETAGEYVDD